EACRSASSKESGTTISWPSWQRLVRRTTARAGARAPSTIPMSRGFVNWRPRTPGSTAKTTDPGVQQETGAMNFGFSDEQKLIIETTRSFVEHELFPHEAEVERTGTVRRELIEELKAKAIAA